MNQFAIIDGKLKRVSFERERNDCIVYDDVVDRSHFTIDADREEVRRTAMLGGGSFDGAYDGNDLPTDLEVQIRSGKFDKAEISQMQKQTVEDIKKSKTDAEKQDALDKAKAINDARQAHLDKMTGFTGLPQGKVDNA